MGCVGAMVHDMPDTRHCDSITAALYGGMCRRPGRLVRRRRRRPRLDNATAGGAVVCAAEKQ